MHVLAVFRPRVLQLGWLASPAYCFFHARPFREAWKRVVFLFANILLLSFTVAADHGQLAHACYPFHFVPRANLHLSTGFPSAG